MPEYRVTLPIAGTVSCVVDAVNEEAALRKALNMNWLEKIETTPEFELCEIDSYETIVEGNVCYIDVYEAEVEKEDD